ncbi:hypothetical protein HYX70_01160 [Candidatus Saccharibacteria bacterium]|nr:hypothetical protein [Candidatus Saccharibacteria bacterium]
MDNQKIPTDQFGVVLFKELGIEAVSDEQKAELLDTMAEIVQNRLAVRIIDALTETELNELVVLMDAGDDTKVGQYLNDHVLDYQAIVAEEIRRMKTELFEDVSEARKALRAEYQK